MAESATRRPARVREVRGCPYKEAARRAYQAACGRRACRAGVAQLVWC